MHEDSIARARALDITDSFIVQAPAGSGKTEILTQRCLKLLAFGVKAPEEILAVTFTRKAAAEMRHRLVLALQKARGSCPSLAHEKVTWELGNAVLKKDALLKWQLEENPNRLRIVTIDALCAALVNRMPVLSQIGGNFHIVDSPEEEYEKAVKSLFLHTTIHDKGGAALKVLLSHLDNRIEKISAFLVGLLSKRDQWLPYWGAIKSQENLTVYLEEALDRLVSEHVSVLRACFSKDQAVRLLSLIRYAANECSEHNPSHPITRCIDLVELPSEADLPLWVAIAHWLTTQQGSFRQSLNKTVGFPSHLQGKEKKNAFLAFVAECEQTHPHLLPLLIETKYLPLPCFTASQKAMIEALSELLPLLVAHLKVLFQESGKVDFIEVTLKALEALGDPLCASDLALHLDHQLRHILIDEYQDTSVTQYRLFEKLVTGWEEGDGRSLFLVGDPMQSIYRFRGAEVSLFLHTQQQGLGDVFVTPLRLKVNFRASQTLVTWVNNFFTKWFPKDESKALGAIAYSPAVSHKEDQTSKVEIHSLPSGKDHSVKKIVSLIQEVLRENPVAQVAVLARTKRSLYPIVHELKQLSLPFVAHEVVSLSDQVHIMDLISLFRAITDQTDRIAWFSVLRAPWLGLSLADLLILARDKNKLIWDVIKSEPLSNLSQAAQKSLRRAIPLIDYWLSQRQRLPLSQFLRGLWIALGGPACYSQPHFLEEVDLLFQLVDQYDDTPALIRALSKRNADVSSAQTPQIELMTLHKAKGLEFDVVIMPDLQVRTKRSSSLLLWLERPYERGVDLILAPYREHKAEEDPLYQYVAKQLDQKEAYEAVRLFYVGVTRAKKALHLLGELKHNDQGEIIAPSQGSFWAMLWPEVAGSFTLDVNGVKEEETMRPLRTLNRLPADWQAPLQVQRKLNSLLKGSYPPENFPVETDPLWREAGTVFHRLLQYIQREQGVSFEKSALMSLKRKGLSGDKLEKAFKWVKEGVENMMNDPRGKWILDPSHQDRRSEWPLSVSLFGKIENIIIDCAFIDEKGTRWIVDYKLTLETDPLLYQSQLEKYYRALKAFENRPIRYGLYFPLVKKWWEMQGS